MVTPQVIQKFKEEANELYKRDKYIDAIVKYVDGLHACDNYAEEWTGRLPYKSEFGNLPTLEEGQMFY